MPDEEKLRQLKQAVLDQIEAWDGASERGFRDIVRNADDVDKDKRILYALTKAFEVKPDVVHKWGAGRVVPNHFNRWAIVEKIRETLEKQLGTATEA